MAKLVIKKRKDAKESNGMSLRDYDVTIDGNEISSMTGLSLTMGVGEFNECTLNFFVNQVEVDAGFLAAVEAHVKGKKKKEPFSNIESERRPGNVDILKPWLNR